MDNKTFNARVADAAGIAAEDARALTPALAEAIRAYAAEDTSIAVPGFGTFAPLKRDEYVNEEPDGKRTLMPPSIVMTFTPSVILRKKLS